MNQVALITEASALRPLPDAGEATLNVQQAMAVLMAHQAAEFEAGRPEREAATRKRMAFWLAHCWGCRRRAEEYRRDMANYAAGTLNHEYYRARAAEQMGKARDALAFAIQERKSL